MTSLAEIKGMGTTTPQRRGLSLAEIKGKTTSTPSVIPEPVQQPGFLKSLVMGTGVPRLAANVVRAAQIAIPGGYSSKDFEKNPAAPVNMPWLGQVKPVGLEGTVGQRAKDTLGESLKLASTVVPVGGTVANIGRATLAGRIGRGFAQGAMGGAVGGSMYGLGEGLQQEDATIGSVLSSAAEGGVLGGVTGGVLGGALPAVGAGVRGTVNLATNKGRTNTASNIMQRVARVNALDQQKFRDLTGKEVGQYLTERGIYGSPEDIAAQLGMRWKASRDTADAALAQIDGKFQGNALNSALKWLITREQKVSSPGAASQNLRLVTKLSEKHRSEGLTMAEINEVKRLFEKNIRINYSRGASPNPDIVAKATTLDDALRKWQFENAKGAGLHNLDEINKETQAAYTLAKALEKKLQRSKGNNTVSLTDWIVLSNGDPKAVAAFFAKKALSSSGVQSSIASKLAGTPTVAMPTPKSGPVMGAIEGRTMQPQPQPAQTVLPKSSSTVKPQYNFPSSKLSTGNPQYGSMMGGVAGFEMDDEGNVTFNPAKALLGIGGMAAASRLYKTKVSPETVARNIDGRDLVVIDDFLRATSVDVRIEKAMNDKRIAKGFKFLQDAGLESDMDPNGLVLARKYLLDVRGAIQSDKGLVRKLNISPETPDLTTTASRMKAEGKTFEEFVAKHKVPDGIKIGKGDMEPEITGAYSGQVSGYFPAYDTKTGKKIAYVDFSDYNGNVQIDMVEVNPGYRGKGLGQTLVSAVQKEFPESKLSWGMMTGDGAALKKSYEKTRSQLREIWDKANKK